MEKFYKFQTYLYELSILVEALPQDGCDLMPDDNTTSVSSNSTTQAPKVRQQTAHVVKKTGHRNSKLSTCSAYQMIQYNKRNALQISECELVLYSKPFTRKVE